MKLVSQRSDKEDIFSQPSEWVYEQEDDAGEGKPVYFKIIMGNHGPWIEIYKVNPIEHPDELPDSQINIDYFDQRVRLRYWEEGVFKATGTDDVEPTHIFRVLDQEGLEKTNE